MKLKLFAASLLSLIALTSASYGDTVFLNGALTTSDPTFHHPSASTTGTGIQYYDVYAFTVTANGSYIFEAASVNTTNNPSNALDTFLVVYANVFNPVAPGSGQAFDDDFTGTRTVLPGPYAANGVTATSTGFVGANPGSRLGGPPDPVMNLVAGTNYFLVVTSFRSTDQPQTGTNAQPTGTYYLGLTGPGTIVIVPEPSTTALIGIVGAGVLGLCAWRKRKAA
jgi:hypothetical protein